MKGLFYVMLFMMAMILAVLLCGCTVTFKPMSDTVYVGGGRGEPVMLIDGLWWVDDVAECPGSPDDVTVTLRTRDNKLWTAEWEYYGMVELENRKDTQ